MQENRAYITETAVVSAQENSLRNYVSKLDSKVANAQWKQNLILTYNYLPLANIKEKLENSLTAYQKKMETEEARLKAIVDNEEMMTLLSQLSSFKSKLEHVQKDLSIKIEQQKKTVKELKSKAQERRQQLKVLRLESRKQTISQLQQNGIRTARQIRTILLRSKSTFSSTDIQTTRAIREQPCSIFSLFTSCIDSLGKSRKKPEIQKKNELKQLFKQKASITMPTKPKQSTIQRSITKGTLQNHILDVEIEEANNTFLNPQVFSNYHSVPNWVHVQVKENREGEGESKEKRNIEWEDFRNLQFDGLVRLVFQRENGVKALQGLLWS